MIKNIHDFRVYYIKFPILVSEYEGKIHLLSPKIQISSVLFLFCYFSSIHRRTTLSQKFKLQEECTLLFFIADQ